MSYGCLTDWVSMSADGVRMGEAACCFATLLLTSLPLSIGMLIMLRHAAPLRPTAVSAVGGLAIAAMTSFALALLHDLDATIMILIWNLGVAAFIVGLVSAFGRTALNWVAAHSCRRFRRSFLGGDNYFPKPRTLLQICNPNRHVIVSPVPAAPGTMPIAANSVAGGDGEAVGYSIQPGRSALVTAACGFTGCGLVAVELGPRCGSRVPTAAGG